MDLPEIPEHWKIQKNPPGITRSFQFETYQDTSDFLEKLADLSEKKNYYPNLNFTRTQVNVNIDILGKPEEFNADQVEYGFATEAGMLIASATN